MLRSHTFGPGRRIAKDAIDFAVAEERIQFVAFLLSPSRKHLGALAQLGARQVGQVSYDGAAFTKFRLETM